MNDNFFQTGFLESKKFYSVSTSDYDFSNDPTGVTYARIVIRMEAREDTYERTVFSFFDFTGLIGGVFELFEITGSIIVGYFASKLFFFSMFADLYQVQKVDYKAEQDLKKNMTKGRKIDVKSERRKLHEESKVSNNQAKHIRDECANIVNQSKK